MLVHTNLNMLQTTLPVHIQNFTTNHMSLINEFAVYLHNKGHKDAAENLKARNENRTALL